MKKTTKSAKGKDPLFEDIKKELDLDARTQCIVSAIQLDLQA